MHDTTRIYLPSTLLPAKVLLSHGRYSTSRHSSIFLRVLSYCTYIYIIPQPTKPHRLLAFEGVHAGVSLGKRARKYKTTIVTASPAVPLLYYRHEHAKRSIKLSTHSASFGELRLTIVCVAEVAGVYRLFWIRPTVPVSCSLIQLHIERLVRGVRAQDGHRCFMCDYKASSHIASRSTTAIGKRVSWVW